MRLRTKIVEIVPPFPVRLSGYMYRTEPTDEVRNPVYARAAIFDDENGNQVYMLSLEVLSITAEFFERFRDAVNMDCWISATHTHSGPSTTDDRYESWFFREVVPELQPDSEGWTDRAVLGSRQLDVRLGGVYNRDGEDGELKPNQANSVYSTERVTAFYLDDGTSYLMMAIPLHSTVLGPFSNVIDGDSIGALYRMLEDDLHTECFLMYGFGGNQCGYTRSVPRADVASNPEAVAGMLLASISKALVHSTIEKKRAVGWDVAYGRHVFQDSELDGVATRLDGSRIQADAVRIAPHLFAGLNGEWSARFKSNRGTFASCVNGRNASYIPFPGEIGWSYQNRSYDVHRGLDLRSMVADRAAALVGAS